MTVTERAKKHLKEGLSQVRPTPESNSCFRIVKDGPAFRLEVGEPQKADETFTTGGDTVLAVEPAVATQVETMTLDVDTSKGSVELVFLSDSAGGAPGA